MAAFADVKEALLRFLSGVEGETPEGRKAKLENLCLLLATKPWNEQERQNVRGLYASMRLSDQEMDLLEKQMLEDKKIVPEDKSKNRRSQQDFSRFCDFLSPEDWELVRSGRQFMEKSERLSGVLYKNLGLRLPSENTFAAMLAVVLILQEEQDQGQWMLHQRLQQLKNVFKGVCKHMKEAVAEPKDLLNVLPSSWEDLPEEQRGRFAVSPPCVERDRPVQQALLAYASARIPLRSTHLAAANPRHQVPTPTAPEFPPWMSMAVPFAMQLGAWQSTPQIPGLTMLGNRGMTSLQIGLKDGQADTAPPEPVKPLPLLDAPQASAGTLVPADPARALPKGNMEASASAAAREDSLFAGLAPEAAAQKLPPDMAVEALDHAMGEAKAKAKKTKEVAKPRAKPPACKKPAAAPKKVSKGPMKRPACKEKVQDQSQSDADPGGPSGPISFDAKHYGACKAEFYTHKSYIRHKVQGSLKMVIGHSAGNHRRVVHALIKHVKAGKSREQLLSERAKLL